MAKERRIKSLLRFVLVALALAWVADVAVMYWLPPMPDADEAPGREPASSAEGDRTPPATRPSRPIDVEAGRELGVAGMPAERQDPPSGALPFYARVTGGTQEAFRFAPLAWDGRGWRGSATQKHPAYGSIHGTLRVTVRGKEYRATFVEPEGKAAATWTLASPGTPWDHAPKWTDTNPDGSYWDLGTSDAPLP